MLLNEMPEYRHPYQKGFDLNCQCMDEEYLDLSYFCRITVTIPFYNESKVWIV